ncbi:MurR/RpiR family transcriptional regulator [Cytobacillus suaedae]|nr:MurR/RpiR family transcriptional regulator [Cytobacillus suaedae]
MNTQTPYCFTRIRAVYSKLSDKEKMVADYILEHPDKIIHSTISQIAENLEIADATVFRFCKRIGFKGYQAMKIALASEIVSPIKEIHDTITEEDDEATVVQKVFKSNIKTIEDTLQVIDPEQFKKAVCALINARKIEFYGSGGSGAIAMDGHHKFLRSGLLTSCYTDAHLQIMSASQLTEEDVVVCISHSGMSKDIIESLEVAKSRGATTIAITSYSKTPLSKKADITLFTVSEETEFRSEALASRLAQLTIIDALYVNVSVKLKDQMQASLKRMRKAVAVKRV